MPIFFPQLSFLGAACLNSYQRMWTIMLYFQPLSINFLNNRLLAFQIDSNLKYAQENRASWSLESWSSLWFVNFGGWNWNLCNTFNWVQKVRQKFKSDACFVREANRSNILCGWYFVSTWTLFSVLTELCHFRQTTDSSTRDSTKVKMLLPSVWLTGCSNVLLWLVHLLVKDLPSLLC